MRETVLILLALSGAARADGMPPPSRCELQVILVMESPAPPLVASLARKAGVGLTLLREAGTRSYVFRLTARGGEQQCLRGLERLRKDARVQSAEIDARRRAQGT